MMRPRHVALTESAAAENSDARILRCARATIYSTRMTFTACYQKHSWPLHSGRLAGRLPDARTSKLGRGSAWPILRRARAW